jgi:hypothetical protein
MKQLPNLLKQETNSASVYISLLNRMISDEADDRFLIRDEIEGHLIGFVVFLSLSLFSFSKTINGIPANRM